MEYEKYQDVHKQLQKEQSLKEIEADIKRLRTNKKDWEFLIEDLGLRNKEITNHQSSIKNQENEIIIWIQSAFSVRFHSDWADTRSKRRNLLLTH